MRKTIQTLTTIGMALLLVLTSAGVTFMRCAHTGHVTMTLLSATAMSEDECPDDGCASAEQCMVIKTVRLSPMTPTTVQHFVATPVAPCVPAWFSTVTETLLSALPHTEHIAPPLMHGPPRQWLNRLCTLLI